MEAIISSSSLASLFLRVLDVFGFDIRIHYESGWETVYLVKVCSEEFSLAFLYELATALKSVCCDWFREDLALIAVDVENMYILKVLYHAFAYFVDMRPS